MSDHPPSGRSHQRRKYRNRTSNLSSPCGSTRPNIDPRVSIKITVPDSQAIAGHSSSVPDQTKPHRYDRVRALAVRWARDDTGSHKDHKSMMAFLKNQLGARITCLHLRGLSAEFDLAIAVSEFMQDAQPNDLLIFYYVGHGSCKVDRVYPHTLRIRATTHSSETSFPLNPFIFDRLFSAGNDTLVFLDCCHAGAAIRGRYFGRKDVMSACGYMDWTPRAPPGRAKGESFTNLMVQAGYAFQQPFTPLDWLSRAKTIPLARTPEYHPYETSDRHQIFLWPLLVESPSVGRRIMSKPLTDAKNGAAESAARL